MIKLLISIFIILHGLVHIWYFTLSRRLVEFEAQMGWSGKSWLFSGLLGDAGTRMLASLSYIFATLVFVASGVGIFLDTAWWRPLLLFSALISSVVIILFWDGKLQMLLEKGALGLLINIVIIVALFVFNWSPIG